MSDGGGEAGFTTLDELEAVASRKVLEHVWAYVQGGAGEERSLRANHAEFQRWSLRPSLLRGVSEVDPSTSLLGTPVRSPVCVAPMAYAAQVHPEGERAIAKAAAAHGALAIYSTLSSYSLEEIASASGSGPRWFQLYLQPDFEVSRRLVERAERAGYSAIVLTLDVPVLGVRDRQARGGFAIDASLPTGNGPDVVPPPRSPSRQADAYRLRSESGSTWEVVDQLRSVTSLPLVVKGILTPEDGQHAVDHGARGIIVSNHGGRQLDGAPATLSVLPEVLEAVGTRAEVYLDGGVRRGADVAVALALGARGVGVGRPVLWALAAGGEPGVLQYLSLLDLELATVMALVGRAKVAELDRSLLRSNDGRESGP